jgi:hypothetical protein
MKGVVIAGGFAGALGLLLMASAGLNLIGYDFATGGKASTLTWSVVGLERPLYRFLVGLGVTAFGSVVSNWAAARQESRTTRSQ